MDQPPAPPPLPSCPERRSAQIEGLAPRRRAVGESALILGYAGLLPQVAAAATCVFDATGAIGSMFAFGYAALILSFLGGIWWGFAMHARRDQARIACVAVAPSLIAAGLILLSIGNVVSLHWALVLLGSAVLLTLPVDRWLTREGIAPDDWMALRVPLSLGLGGATIVIGAICGTLAG